MTAAQMSAALDFARRFGESEGTFAYLGCIDRYGCRHCSCRDYYAAPGEPYRHSIDCPWVQARIIAGLSIESERLVLCPSCQATHERSEHAAHDAEACASVIAKRNERRMKASAAARRQHLAHLRADTVREDFVFATAPDRVIAVDIPENWGETPEERQATWDAYPPLPEMQWEMLAVRDSQRECSAVAEGADGRCRRRAFFFLARDHASRCFFCVPPGTQPSGTANARACERFVRERTSESYWLARATGQVP